MRLILFLWAIYVLIGIGVVLEEPRPHGAWRWIVATVLVVVLWPVELGAIIGRIGRKR